MSTNPVPHRRSMRIDVAMTVHDGEAHLAEQLSSIAGQTRLPDRLIVLDDASRDRSPEILRRFIEGSPFEVLWLRGREAAVGSGAAFERVLQECDGDLVAVCDQDDIWWPDRLRTLEGEFRCPDPPAAVFCDATVVDDAGHELDQSLWHVLRTRRAALLRSTDFLVRSLARPSVPGCVLVVRRDVTQLALPFPPALCEGAVDLRADGWLVAMSAATGTVLGLDTALMSYRVHSTQQIGIDGHARGERVRRAWHVLHGEALVEDELAKRLAAVELVRNRLAERLGAGDECGYVAALDEMVAHLVRRRDLPAGFWMRLPDVADELLAGCYARFSSGAASAAADLTRGIPSVRRWVRGSLRARLHDRRLR